MHESLSLTNVSKLPPHLRSRAKSAANGSFSDLILLLRLVSEPTDHRRVLFLPLLFIHLDPSGIPTPKDLDSILCNVSRHPELGRITGALAALNAIAEMIEARGVVPPAAYADLWPRLYRWTLFVHAYWEVIPDMDLAATYRATAIIVLALHRDDNTKAAVNKAAGLHCILAEYWAKIVRNELSPNVQLVASIHTFLFDYDYDSEGGKDRTKFMEILEGCGGSEGHLAYLFVQQINNTVGGRVTAPATTIVNSVIQALSSHGKGRLTTAMLAHGGAKALIDALHFAEEARHIFPSAAEKVYIGVTYLMGNFESDAGAELAWVSQALSAGLLRLIAILGRSRRTQSDEMWFTWAILQRFLIKCLPDALVHYKIAGQIVDALPPALSITSTATFSGCVIDSFWTDFVELLKERLGALNFWLERRSMSLNVCENTECDKTGGRRAFKQCARCKLACYCSRKCQTADWEAHRASCRTLGSTDLGSARQRDYVRAILQHNFKSPAIMTAVLTQQARFMYKNRGVDFITVYDFTRNARGVNLSYTSKCSGAWSEAKPKSDYSGRALGVRLTQLLDSTKDIRVHLIILSFDVQKMAPVRILPLWSTSELHDKLSCIVQALPSGLYPAALDAALVMPLRTLAASAAEVIQEIYY